MLMSTSSRLQNGEGQYQMISLRRSLHGVRSKQIYLSLIVMAASRQQVPPMDFDKGNVCEHWTRWRELMELLFAGPDADKWTQEQKAAQFLICIGEKGREICRSWTASGAISAEGKKDPNVLFEKFEAYCNPKKNITVQRKVFYKRQQGKTESIDEWVTQLHLIAKDCAFQDCDDMIKDRIVMGSNSREVQEKLLLEEDLTINSAVKIARAYETSRTHMQLIHSDTEVLYMVQRKSESNLIHIRKANNLQDCAEQTLYRSCTKCGTKHNKNTHCPAQGKICYKCQKNNHFARVCRNNTIKYRKSVNQVEQDENETDSDIDQSTIFLAMVDKTNVEQDEVYVEILVSTQNIPIKFKIDTGAQVNCIPASTYYDKLANICELEKSGLSKLVGYGGHRLHVLGKCSYQCMLQNKKLNLEFYVIDTPAKPVLGLSACKQLNLIKIVMTVDQYNKGLSKQQVEELFSDVFQGLGCLPGECSIKLKPDAHPVIHSPRRIPIAIKDKLKEELDRMVNLGVLEKVDEPTEWVSSMVAVEKKNSGALRICIDPRDLNREIMRKHYSLPTLDDITHKLAHAKFFSVLDAQSGYWQLKLDEQSSRLTTFNSPFGRWRFTRVPFGFASAQEIFQKKAHETIEGLHGVDVIIDDLLVYGSTRKEHDQNLCALLERCRERNMKLNPGKMQIGVTQVKYFGHILSQDGLKADPEKIAAIQHLDPPTSKKELETILGMFNYLTRFVPGLAEATAPLRELLQKDALWSWNDSINNVFEDVKGLIVRSSETGLQYFYPKKEVTIQVDASQFGLGAVLMQEGRPVAYASRSMTPTQRNYSQIEKEMLAIVIGCEKFHQYIYGQKVTVETDHKPLMSIMEKPLVSAPPRLQRMILRIQKYDMHVVYVPGNRIPVADMLSRTFKPGQDEREERDLEEYVHSVLSQLPATDEKLKEIQLATERDATMANLITIIRQGWPNSKAKVNVDLKPYWNVRKELSIIFGIVFKGERIVVPPELSKEIIRKLHIGHFGIALCKRRARDLLYWPGMNSQIEDMVNNCATCQENQRANQKEPMVTRVQPERAWQRIASDQFTWNHNNYLIMVDYYSRYFEIVQLRDTKSSAVINVIKSVLAKHGICDELISDNGSQYSSIEFANFAKEWGFKHTLSSPHYPQSNGLAEKYVQIAKNILEKAAQTNQDPYLCILNYRNTPIDGIASPS
ncbi:ankyrin repeat and SOCS box protein 4 isoform X1 [Bombina bombina]|uniref:ankyrin repeat and SOCS box protein 4 isoform X1 n=1 Tax=Bombina bombina TaxID=8345 RepID=UPI00235B12A0|nr:ankyrin repeat and SOCS box protein 4 isoform X1 [Bombina bombina]